MMKYCAAMTKDIREEYFMSWRNAYDNIFMWKKCRS